MTKVKAVTHHHHKFLKQAYKMDGIVDLVNDERYLSLGDRYIRFDPASQTFVVCIKTVDQALRVRAFDNLISAVNCAKRV